jgi:hypothetical protein
MARERNGMTGHVWTTLDDEPVHDSPELLSHLVPVLAFGPRGEVRKLAEPSSSTRIAPGSPPRTQRRNDVPEKE